MSSEMITIESQTVSLPEGTQSASIYVDRTGLIHIADVKMRNPWRWFWVGVLAGTTVTTVGHLAIALMR